ncbi:hypothetical protein [Brevibacterium album]|uniref:hypothetical protein n=1 Tax=Brevibacterium album TaxID=417948 RepID=UPI00041A5FA0|nr:hypothetical protein [Brevibacterium album]
MRRLTDFLLPEVPLARVACLRAIVYAFVLVDVWALSNDVLRHAMIPEFYAPLLLPRLLGIGPVTHAGAVLLLALVTASALIAMSGRLPRISGWVVAGSFWCWMFYSQGYGYVAHDHMALMIAVLVLPTVGAAGFREAETSRAAGWALRCIQIAVVLTYFFSVWSKWVRSGTLAEWANGAVFVWAIMRRGTPLITWTLSFPWLLVIAQWCLLIVEILSPVALFLKGRWLYLTVGFFMLFHLATFLSLGISFLPTVICWAAFLPLERVLWRLRPGLAPHQTPVPPLDARS